jgi:5-methylcytosine-specific restriction endonuclease McrA
MGSNQEATKHPPRIICLIFYSYTLHKPALLYFRYSYSMSIIHELLKLILTYFKNDTYASPTKVTYPTLSEKGNTQRENRVPQDTDIGESDKIATPTHENNWTAPIGSTSLSADSKWRALKMKVIQRDDHACVLCGSKTNLTVDHIKELSLGGTNAMINLRTLCKDCHEQRHNRKFLEYDFDADDNYGENYKISPKVEALNKAMKTGKGIGIKYVDGQGLYSERVIYPIKLYRRKYVYVDAYCELDKDDRVFRLSRMRICKSRWNFYDNPSNSYTGAPWTGTPWKHG